MSYFNIEEKIQELKTALNESSDFAYRYFKKNGAEIGFVFLKSITDQNLLSSAIYYPLQTFEENLDIDVLKNRILKCADIKEAKEDEIIDEILNGKVIMLTNFSSTILAVDLLKFATRIPSEPPTSPVIQGPREGFVEDIQTNITLLRRRLKTKDLVLKTMKVGSQSQTKVVVTYLKSTARKEVVDEVIRRINNIQIDGIIDSYYILSFLENRPNSLFKQVGSAEKPDIIVSKMLEGKVAIMVDNSPIVLTVPFAIIEDLQNSNDYYTNYHYSTVIRIIRVIGLLLAILAPGVYLALQIYHYNIIPLNFLITIADTTLGLPFTPFLEIIFIFLLFQILYEVSLRLPSYLGLATSIVGALILGDTGVKAGLISPPGVIIVALSKIALYTVPEESSQITVLQLVFLVLGGSMGLVGIVAGMVYLMNYLNCIDSYGTPYLAPYSPRIPSDLKDAVAQVSLVNMKKLPKTYRPRKENRK